MFYIHSSTFKPGVLCIKSLRRLGVIYMNLHTRPGCQITQGFKYRPAVSKSQMGPDTIKYANKSD